jgi:tetratricopeptide (TPR) repeat protein
LRARLSTWLLRPYLDLGPLHTGPLHAGAVEQAWDAFSDPRMPPFVAQRAMPRGFRTQLADEAGGAPYALTDPRALADGYRTDRWQRLCEALDGWRELSGESKCRLASLLHSMCLYEPLLTVIPDATILDAPRADAHTIELAYWRASATFMHELRGRIADYHDADLSVFEDIASSALDVGPAGFNATALVLVHRAKTGAPVHELEAWRARLERALERVIGTIDDFTAQLFTSRYYRAVGFLPQRRGDRPEVTRVMDLAEQHALSLTPVTPAQQLLYRENLHAVMESRTKEALWLDDRDRALARSLKVVEVDPYDSKAWVEVGEVRFLRKEWHEAAQAYAVAGMLGPPASAVGRHMAGVCLREVGQDMLAATFFKDAAELDPLGLSPREEIHDLPDMAVLKALKDWSRATYWP